MVNGRGFSLIELMVGLVVFAILLSTGIPAFNKWVQGSQIRTEAESIQNGLQLARAEAVRRNVAVRFQLVDEITNGCAQSTTGVSWVISLDDTAGNCGKQKLNDAFLITDATNNPYPRIIQTHSAGEGVPNVRVSTDQATVSFNGLGRQVSVPLAGGTSTPTPPAEVKIDISNPKGGSCAADTHNKNDMHCLRVVVSPAGKVRMCDPSLANTDAQAC